MKGESRLDAIRDDIVRLTNQERESEKLWTENRSAGLQSLLTKLGSLQKEHDVCLKQIKILESLYFTELRRRWYVEICMVNAWVMN